ncbi:hypothetical protein SH467x_001379 [Pirellulaceae bacterium SH467]
MNSNIGNWLKLHRQIIDSEVFFNPSLLQLWLWLLVKAAYRTQHIPMKTGRGWTTVTLSPGQLVTGRSEGASAIGIPESTFRNRLKKLEEMGMIVTDPSDHWTVISIVNWSIFQATDSWEVSGEITIEGQGKDKQIKSDLSNEIELNTHDECDQRTGKRQQKDTYKKANKSKNLSIDTPALKSGELSEASEGRLDYPKDFEAFWEAFPSKRRQAKKATFKSWQKVCKNIKQENASSWLIDRAKVYAGSPKGQGEYVMSPEVWLNKGCYYDSPEAWGIPKHTEVLKPFVPPSVDEPFKPRVRAVS